MDLKKRLFRRPVTTVLWALLLTLAVMLLCLGSAIRYASDGLLTVLDQHYTTIAARTDRATYGTPVEGGVSWENATKYLWEDDLTFLNSLDCVEAVNFHTLTAAYSPDLSPMLGLTPFAGSFENSTYMVNETYDELLFEGTIELIFEPAPLMDFDLTALGQGAAEPLYGIDAVISIDRIIAGHGDYPYFPEDGISYTGKVTCHINFLGEQALNYLQEGQRYLFSGYYAPAVYAGGADPTGQFRDMNAHLLANTCAVFDGDCLRYYDAVVNGITLGDPETAETIWTYEYTPQGLAAVKLEGTVDEFLADPANVQWAQLRDRLNAALQTLPVLGTNDLESMPLFVNNKASIVEGRSFSKEDYENGEKVLILSQSLALKSGISVGDTISLSQFYSCGTPSSQFYGEGYNDVYNYSVDLHSVDGMLNNPTAGTFLEGTEFVTEDEQFTVIGLYRLENEWEDSSYSITPNTLFTPQKAQIPGGFGGLTTEVTISHEDGSTETRYLDNGAYGVYLSIRLKNGSMTEFLEAIKGTSLEGEFLTFDQGYDAIRENIRNIVDSAGQLFYVAVAGWALLILLYLLLFQNAQRRNLGIMRSVGARPSQARRYLFTSGLLVAGIAVILGSIGSFLLMDVVQEKMASLIVTPDPGSIYSTTQLTGDTLSQMLSETQMPVQSLITLALLQLGIIALLLWLHAALLSRKKPRKLLGV